MVLKINIHRYTDKYKTVLSLKKKKTKQNKQTKDLTTLFKLFSLIITAF